MLDYQHFTQPKRLPDALVIGNGIIDREHSLLLDQLASLNASKHLWSNDEAVGEALYNISNLLLEHFVHEEAIMKSSAMPESTFAQHLSAHLTIIEELCQLQSVMMMAPLVVGEMLATIEQWIVVHIRDFDLQIKNYV